MEDNKEDLGKSKKRRQICGDRILVKKHEKESTTGIEVGSEPIKATIMSIGHVVRGEIEDFEVGQEVLIEPDAPSRKLTLDGEVFHSFRKHDFIYIL